MPVFREVTRDGTGGLLFELGNARDLADKIDTLLRDDALRARCHEQAASLVEAYDWEALGDETAAVFKDVIQKRTRRARR
jgi:glycosyltransferase involved in cell wall biosynthesis